jgi:putative protease
MEDKQKNRIAPDIELLAPAGSPEALDAAVGEGADAVYLGLKDFNARLRSANFTYSQFEGALNSLRRMGKKVYVTVNTVFEQREADRVYQMLKYLASQGPDALIVQDFGVLAMTRSEFPSLRLHASTQMNIASARGANALSRHSVSRVVLARELSLEELRGIRCETNLELEVFVHGALCISVSGLCFFSSFLGGKSANRGMCTQACRRLYRSASGERGYYFSPNDLQLLECVPELAAAGINALKIEGRMKSASYVGAVVSAYRIVTDAVLQGDEEHIRRSIEQGRVILRNDFARPKTRYFFNGEPSSSAGIDWLNVEQDGGTGISLGAILKVKGSGGGRCALISPPQELVLQVGDSVRIHRSDDSNRSTYKLSSVQPDDEGFWVSVPEGFPGDRVYLIQTKTMSKRYAPVITRNSGGKGPGVEKAPMPSIMTRPQEKDETFPEGLYVAVSRLEDLFIVQSSRPERVMLSLSPKNARYLLADNKPPLPFKPAEIILTFDPWFPQGLPDYGAENIAAEIAGLVGKGYLHYTLNNLGQFSLFREFRDKVRLIAGPWLYMFNSWALSFVVSLGAEAFISPLENNRQNLERTLEVAGRRIESRHGKMRRSAGFLHSKFFITVFAWPPLFNIRADLGTVLDFDSFMDNKDEDFTLATCPSGSRVYPYKHYSIIDKIPFLKEAGFGRFIIDLSGSVIKKSDYRNLLRSVKENAPLPHSSRFNWKDGFYRSQNTGSSSLAVAKTVSPFSASESE